MVSLRRRFAELIPELAKFGVVGLIGSVIDLGGAAYLHGDVGIEAMAAKALSITAATVVTYLGSRFWTFRHRVNQALLREGTLFVALNVVGLVIAEAVIAFTTYGLDAKSALAYNAASVAGTGLGTIFRYFSYKKWVFLAGAPGAAVAAGEAAVSGIVDPTETSEAGAVLAGTPEGSASLGRLVAPVDPFLQVRRFGTDGGVGSVAGVDHRVRVEDQQAVADRVDDRAEVGKGPSGRARTSGEQRVPAEQPALLRQVEAHGAARMPGCVPYRGPGPGDFDRLPVGQVPVRRPAGIGLIPEFAVGGVQPDRRAGGLSQVRSGIDVVVVGVGAQDGGEPARPHGGQDRVRVMRGIDDHAFGVVAEQPDVVVYVPGAPVKGERAGRDEMVHGDHHSRS